MPLAIYVDHHVPRAITLGLRTRGVDVLTAFEDGAARFEDPDLLNRAMKLRRVLFTQDEDFLEETTQRLEAGIEFFGVIFARQMDVTVGACIRDLEYFAKVGEPEDVINQVYFLPL